MESMLLLVVLFAIMYVMLIRPENKRKKKIEAMRNALRKGDTVTTIGGVIGKVVAIDEEKLTLETSEDRVRVEFLKSAIATVGTLDEQEAAAQRKPKAKKDAEESAEPAIEEKTSTEE